MAGGTSAQDGAPAPPLVTAPVPLTASDAGALAAFGSSIAIDGDTAIVGAPGVSGGAAYVLVWDGSAWIEQAKIVPPSPADGDGFGHAVAISGDTVLVGAPGVDHMEENDAGAAYVFARSGAAWSLQATLTAGEPDAVDKFGWAVALDGDTAAVGATGRDCNSHADCGAVTIFARSGATWTETAVIQALTPFPGAKFGFSLALAGSRLAVGEDRTASAVTTFTGGGAAWSLESRLAPSYTGTLNFGAALALDGDTLVAGSPGDLQFVAETEYTGAGAVYAFVWDGTAWVQQARLQPEVSDWQDALERHFGRVTALDGDNLLAGSVTGTAFLYTRSGGVWSSGTQLIGPDESGEFGEAVALAGGWLLVGAPDVGTVYAYRITPGVDLALAAAHVPALPVEGQRLVLVFTVTNAGPDRAAGIGLDVTLPAALSFESASASQGSGCAPSGGGVACDLGALEPGAQATATIAAVLEPGTTGAAFTVAASVAAQEPDLDPANNAVAHVVTAAPYRVPPGCRPSEQGVVICTTH
jgi:uncharacterized repeat protein (TIGR01451 family)